MMIIWWIYVGCFIASYFIMIRGYIPEYIAFLASLIWPISWAYFVYLDITGRV